MNICEAPTVGDLIELLVERGLRVKDAHDAIARAIALAPPPARRPKKAAQPGMFGDDPPPAGGAPAAGKPRRVATTWPDGFMLSDDLGAFAQQRGFNDSEIRRMWERFRDRNISRGEKYVDWKAAWRTWVNNQVEFRSRDNAKHTGREQIDRRL
ncbi:hypothetical protein [Bradyrhizobium neotropicale]|uniref:hypothetical protein n=1 Tax=Bradyrhizobium neotropicale TaxID=1497615 RepID=UPI001AD62D3E|nr:hypothetical protein [Bradyrhizobium neotropicale]MBO4228494.1 hypothetical protein [Bradyrhizobium neotropicale]